MDIFERRESNVRGYCRAFPTVFAKAKNAEQWDEAGKRYIDFFAGAGVLLFGHNDAAMKKAMIAFLEGDGVAHSLDMYTPAKRRFLEQFEEIVLKPRGLDYKLQFTGPTGTNCVEAALKLARKVTGRRNVVAFTDAFHGMTLGSLACTGNRLFRNAAGVPLENVVRVPFDGYAGSNVDSLEPLRAALADSSSGIEPPAAFVVETIQAEGGVNVASTDWLMGLQTLARQYGSLLIVDDIQVGIGRSGSFFSFEGTGIEPDLVCLAKGVGGFGTPLAVLLIKPEHDKWAPSEHTGTFRGQGLSFVAGAEALQHFRDGTFLGDVKRKGEIMAARLQAIAKGNGGMKVRGRGMIYGLDVGRGEVSAKISKQAFENGLIVAPCGPEGRILKLIPPLTIEDSVLAEGLDIFETAVRAVASK